jgi:hypothetical protein
VLCFFLSLNFLSLFLPTPFALGFNQPSYGIDLKVTMTTKGVWPEKDEMAALIIPDHLQERLAQYRSFYLSLNPQRRVAWMHRSLQLFADRSEMLLTTFLPAAQAHASSARISPWKTTPPKATESSSSACASPTLPVSSACSHVVDCWIMRSLQVPSACAASLQRARFVLFLRHQPSDGHGGQGPASHAALAVYGQAGKINAPQV